MSRSSKLKSGLIPKNPFEKIIDDMGIRLLKGLESISADKQREFKKGELSDLDVSEIVKNCAVKNLKLAAISNLIPGPSAVALMMPTQVKVIRNQMNMIFEIAKKKGAAPAKIKNFVLEILAKGYLSEIKVPGDINENKPKRKKVSGKVEVRNKVNALSRGIYENNVKKSLTQWIPVGSSVLSAYWVNSQTKKIGKIAEDYFSKN